MLAPKFYQENKSKRFTNLKGLVVRNFVFFSLTSILEDIKLIFHANELSLHEKSLNKKLNLSIDTNTHNTLTDDPIVVLILIDLRLCHPFFNREERKLRAITIFCLSSSSVISSCPAATFMQVTFLSYHLTEALTSSSFLARGS